MCKECKFQVFSKLVQFYKKFGYIEENEVIIIEFKNFKGIEIDIKIKIVKSVCKLVVKKRGGSRGWGGQSKLGGNEYDQ